MKLTRRKFVGGASIVATGIGASVVDFSRNQGPERTRCEGKPISVEQPLTDEPGYDDGFSYFQSNNTVRIVATKNSDGPASFRTESFEEWASTRCADMSISHVRKVTRNRLGSNGFGAGLTSSPKRSSLKSVVILNVVRTDDRDDGAENTPPADFSQLVRVAPRTVDATISVDGETFSRSVAVFAKRLEPATAR